MIEFIKLKHLLLSTDCQHIKIKIQHIIIDLFALTKPPKKTSYFPL